MYFIVGRRVPSESDFPNRRREHGKVNSNCCERLRIVTRLLVPHSAGNTTQLEYSSHPPRPEVEACGSRGCALDLVTNLLQHSGHALGCENGCRYNAAWGSSDIPRR